MAKEKSSTKAVKKGRLGGDNKSLIYKISFAIGTLLVICLTALVAVSATLAARSLNSAVSGEFQGIATENGQIVQSVITSASETATMLQGYIEDRYDERNAEGYSGETLKSEVYDVELQEINKRMEELMISAARTSVANDNGIVGVGVLFEPDAFDPAIRDYSVYIGSDDVKSGNVQSYGSYESYGSEDYYKNAATTQQNCFTEPYEDQGIDMFSAAFPIVYGGETMAVVLVDVDINYFPENLRIADSHNSEMFSDVLNQDGILIYSSGGDVIGQSIGDLTSEKVYANIQAGMKTGASFRVNSKKAADQQPIKQYYTPVDVLGQTWWTSSAIATSDLYQSTILLVVLMVVLAVATLIFIVVVSSRLLNKYISPINEVVATAKKLSDGDFSVSVQAVYDDEIGGLANTFTEMSERLRLIIGDITRCLKEMAANNFDVNSEVPHVGDFKEIEDELFTVASDMSHTLRNINEATELVALNAGQISEGAQALTEGATDQANSVDELQHTIATVSAQVEKNAQNANQANKLAKVVGDEIIKSNDEMQKVVQAMETINESSQQVNSIIQTIDDISSQTNMLALNASIEAARAGEAGRGFAVVATQVGALAAESAQAAKTSSQYIIEALNAVEDGKRVVDQTAAMLLASVEKTNELVSNIGEISNASEEQSEALSHVSQAANQIAAVIEENTAMAEESSASSEELAAQAERLKELTGVFRLMQE